MKHILMNKEMTRAILDGRKVQTRRVLTDKHHKLIEVAISLGECHSLEENHPNDKSYFIDILSKYKKDEVIWVREPARVMYVDDVKMKMAYKFLADGFSQETIIDIPTRFIDMDRTSEIVPNHELIKPRWIRNCQGIPNGCIKEMARIFLKITDVKVERLQDISDKDCIKEGISEVGFIPDDGFPECVGYMIGKDDGKTPLENKPQKPFENLWNKTAPKGYRWENNPYVFVYEFKRVNRDGSER